MLKIVTQGTSISDGEVRVGAEGEGIYKNATLCSMFYKTKLL